jgi:predicted nucleic acid-binding protein
MLGAFVNKISTRANCFDASALVKIYSDESHSELIRNYFYNCAPTRYTTAFCFYEALGVLKSKWLYRKEITREQYSESAFGLTAWFGLAQKLTPDLNFADPIVFQSVREISERHSLDFSDALQIASVKNGYFSAMINDSKTLLVTADLNLAAAARNEGLAAWYFVDEPQP